MTQLVARSQMPYPENEALVPVSDEDAIGLGVGRRTLGRRIKNPPPGFPRAHYFVRRELEDYKKALIAGAQRDAEKAAGLK